MINPRANIISKIMEDKYGLKFLYLLDSNPSKEKDVKKICFMCDISYKMSFLSAYATVEFDKDDNIYIEIEIIKDMRKLNFYISNEGYYKHLRLSVVR